MRLGVNVITMILFEDNVQTSLRERISVHKREVGKGLVKALNKKIC